MRSKEEINLLEYRQNLIEEQNQALMKPCVDFIYYKYLTNQLSLVNIKLIEYRKAKLFGEA